MREPHILLFASFRLDFRDEHLWQDGDAIRLTNRAFEVFRYLVEHPAQLVTKEALLQAVWSTNYVSEAALETCIRELRQALGDDAKTPHMTETVRGCALSLHRPAHHGSATCYYSPLLISRNAGNGPRGC